MSMAGVITVCVLLAVVSNVMAADPNQPKETPKEKSKDNSLVIGVVSIVKDKDGNIVEIKVTAHKDLIYKVVLDEKGMELGKTLADKRARIEGSIEKKGETQWITVKMFSEPKIRADVKQAPKKPVGKPAPAPKQ